MASPVDAARQTTAQVSADPSNVNFTTNVSYSSGDLGLIIGRVGATVTQNLPSGWTFLLNNNTADASDDVTSVIYRQCDGTEGTFLAWDLSAAAKAGYVAYRITGAADPATRAPEISTVTIGTGANADPPAVTPTGGSKDYLFIAVYTCDGVNAASSPPSGYSNLSTGQSSGGAAGTNAIVSSASKQATASTEDPGTFTNSAPNSGNSTFTIAIHPPAAVAADDVIQAPRVTPV